jgi:predicted  nucleic acid-binding Zn-ribbon protein
VVNADGLDKLEKMTDNFDTFINELMKQNKDDGVSTKKKKLTEQIDALDKSIKFYERYPDKFQDKLVAAMDKYTELTEKLQGVLDEE